MKYCPSELLAILFCIDEDNFSHFASTPTIENFFTQNNLTSDFHSLRKFLDEILSNVYAKDLYKNLYKHLLLLNEHKIISQVQFLYICERLQKIAKSAQAQHTLDLESMRASFITLLDELLEYELLNKNALTNIKQNYTNQSFSIGVSGVLSAGKSTFLNALIGKEILGVSNIPETANLGVLKFAQTESAKVHFWDKNEWMQIEHEAHFNESLQEFVEESKASFGDKFYEYIQENSLTKTISCEDLRAFTSANASPKMCNLIKSVEIFSPLKFLQNNVEIVDTPGLDDPITKREEITKNYILKCDLLLHLMNASCVATQNDIDFILEVLLERNVARLLVVLTRADLISKEDLAKTLEYTKTTLSMQILKYSKNIDPIEIISRITFIPISAFYALQNRIATHQKHKMSLEESGILEVEKYLDEVLFSPNSLKARDMLYVALKALLNFVILNKEELVLEKQSMDLNAQDLQKVLVKKYQEIEDLKRTHIFIKQSILDSIKELENGIVALNEFLKSSLRTQKNDLKDKIIENINYCAQKNIKLESSNLEAFFDSAIRDIFTDILRTYKYKLNTKLSYIISYLSSLSIESASSSNTDSSMNLYEDVLHKVSMPSFNFAPKDKHIDHFVRAFAQSTFQNLKDVSRLDSLFQEQFDVFSTLIFEKTDALKVLCMDEFRKLEDKIDVVFKEFLQDREEKLARTANPSNISKDELERTLDILEVANVKLSFMLSELN